MRFGKLEHVPGKFDGRYLHPEAKSKVRNVIFTGVTSGRDFSLDSAFAETTRDKDAAKAFEVFFRSLALQILGVHLLNFDSAIVGNSAMNDGFINRFVSVLEFDVFAYNTDANPMLWRYKFADDLLPMGHISGRGVETQEFANQVVHSFALEH